ncbi:hypothetical protein [Streptomyces sp. NPDC060194]|uniref:hypothetical protein n=1 Tax=Streptomyces sp. NPDC060194 TaxID=3347069 RepID=UPI003652D73B
MHSRRTFITAAVGAGLASPLAACAPPGAAEDAGEAKGRPAGGDAPTERATFTKGWQDVPLAAGAEDARLHAVAAAGPDAAWTVGEQGRSGPTPGVPYAAHWDGRAWTPTPLGHLALTGPLTSVAAGSTDEAWAVGGNTLFTWSDGGWRPSDRPSGEGFTAVTAASDGRVWALGGREGRPGVLHRAAAGGWTWLPPLPAKFARTTVAAGVRHARDGSVWVFATDAVARLADGSWQVVPRPPGPMDFVSGLLPVAADDVWITGASHGAGGLPGKPPSPLLQHYDGTRWTPVSAPFVVGSLGDVVGDEEGRPALIAGWDFWDGTRAHYLVWNGKGWSGERGPRAESQVTQTALASLPDGGGYWSAGGTGPQFAPTKQVRMERFA